MNFSQFWIISWGVAFRHHLSRILDPFDNVGSGDIPTSLGIASTDASSSGTSKSPKQPNYKILEAGDPMTTSIYDATTSLSQSSPTSVTQQ